MRKILFLTVFSVSILFFTLSTVKAGRWLKIAEDELGVFVDMESITFASPNIVRVWSKLENNGLGNPEWQGISYSITYDEIHCKDDESKVIQGTIYYKDGHIENHSSSNWEFIHPYIAIETLHKFICNIYVNLPESFTETSESE